MPASEPAARPAKVFTPPLQPAEPVVNVPKREPPATAAAAKSTKAKPGGPLPLPDLSRLMVYDGAEPDKTDLRRKSDVIEATLNSFRVEARVREINPGPTVTQFALEPGVGVPVRRITALENDLALALAAPSIRIEAPVPGMARVGIEIPNKQLIASSACARCWSRRSSPRARRSCRSRSGATSTAATSSAT